MSKFDYCFDTSAPQVYGNWQKHSVFINHHASLTCALIHPIISKIQSHLCGHCILGTLYLRVVVTLFFPHGVVQCRCLVLSVQTQKGLNSFYFTALMPFWLSTDTMLCMAHTSYPLAVALVVSPMLRFIEKQVWQDLKDLQEIPSLAISILYERIVQCNNWLEEQTGIEIW